MKDPRVDAYIDAAAPFARPILSHIRERVHAVVPDAGETLKWSMPTYTKGGAILIITAAFKQHAALNFWRGKELGGAHADVGAMGQFGQLKSVADLPPVAELDRLIGEAAGRASVKVPRTPKNAPAPPAAIHPDFAEALSANPTARATFDAFSPSARRDYVDWIAEAKQDMTRMKRIATAIEWLAEGKRRNWKYESC